MKKWKSWMELPMARLLYRTLHGSDYGASHSCAALLRQSLRLATVATLLPVLLGAIVIENERYVVEYDAALSALRVTLRGRNAPFVRDVALSHPMGTAFAVAASDPWWGAGKAIEVRYENGSRDRIALYPGLPFVAFQTTLHNDGGQAITVNRLQTAGLRLQLARPVEELKALGTGGLSEVAGAGSYSILAVADPETRNGVVAGWLTHHRGSGVVFGGAEGTLPVMRARLDYGRLRLDPGATEELETLLVGYFDDARLGLEAYADAVAKTHAVRLPPQPTVYCTWYHSRASNETELAETAAFSDQRLAPFGLSVIQIDDGWQAGIKDNGPRKDFTKIDAEGPYPSGMKKTAGGLRARGLTPGIWFMPFAGTWDDPWFADKQDLFATKDGKPFVTRWGGTCLDTTHPRTRDYIRSIAHRVAHDWGYRYFKLDGLWTGTATKIRYINDRYLEDDIGESVLHDPAKTHIEAYRDGLQIVRDAAGQDVFLLGCNVAQNMRTLGASFGLVDAMRIGPDNGRRWDQIRRGPFSGSSLYFLHGRVWYNDPDPIYVRDDVPLEHARALASWVTLTGQLNASSTDYTALSEERLDLLRRTMPAHGLLPRPADLFEQRIARVWLLTDTRREPRRDVIGLFNWDDGQAAVMEYPMGRIGLSEEVRYVGFDYWADKFVKPFLGHLQHVLPAASCRIIAVRPEAKHPVLVSTSRHVTQGIVDVAEERWKPDQRALVGASRLVGGDPYELRIWCPDRFASSGARATFADGSSVEVTRQQTGNELRVRFTAPADGIVEWSVDYR
ncbi:MAG: alpha-galactosidase [bacterium]|nr:alpha-galactosidase [bacterium]